MKVRYEIAEKANGSRFVKVQVENSAGTYETLGRLHLTKRIYDAWTDVLLNGATVIPGGPSADELRASG